VEDIIRVARARQAAKHRQWYLELQRKNYKTYLNSVYFKMQREKKNSRHVVNTVERGSFSVIDK